MCAMQIPQQIRVGLEGTSVAHAFQVCIYD